MSAAAAAAGYLARHGLLPKAEVRNASTQRHVDLQARAHGYVCPYCVDRFSAETIEFHTLMAHGRAFQSSAG